MSWTGSPTECDCSGRRPDIWGRICFYKPRNWIPQGSVELLKVLSNHEEDLKFNEQYVIMQSKV